MVDKVIKNFKGNHEEFMRLFRKAESRVYREEDVDLKSMKGKELRNFAKERCIRGYSRLNKDALINLIDNWLKAVDDE